MEEPVDLPLSVEDQGNTLAVLEEDLDLDHPLEEDLGSRSTGEYMPEEEKLSRTAYDEQNQASVLFPDEDKDKDKEEQSTNWRDDNNEKGDEEEGVDNNLRENIKNVPHTRGKCVMEGSFVPRTMFEFTPYVPPSPPKNTTRKNTTRPKEAASTPVVETSPIFSQTTMKYLKSSGLHSKRIENLLMKYLGPSQPPFSPSLQNQ